MKKYYCKFKTPFMETRLEVLIESRAQEDQTALARGHSQAILYASLQLRRREAKKKKKKCGFIVLLQTR